MKGKTQHILEHRIRDAVSMAIRTELNDPRIEAAMPSVTGVRLAPDMSVAHVNVSIMGDEAAQRTCWRGLQSGRRRLQGYVAKSLRTRTAPELILHLDDSLKRADAVLGKLEQAMADVAADAPPADADAGAVGEGQ